MDLGLAQRVALVTGAGQGIGRAIGLFLAGEGAAVAFHYHTSAAGAESAAASCREAGGRAAAVGADLGQPDDIARLVETVEGLLGPVDILVNNAAYTPTGAFLEQTPEAVRQAFQVTVFGTMEVTRLVLRGMVERRRGSIVTLVGDAGRIGETRLAATAAARAAEMAFVKSVAKEFGRHGIRANAVSLGLVEKPEAPLHIDESQRERALRLYPLRRFGRVEDVPPLVAWLASDLSGWMTGQVVSLNGGYVTA
jgi:3-oxoacyl-[acyl-carrier protein] reductase